MADTGEVLKFPSGTSDTDVSALFLRPRGAKHLLVFAHGAGADMRHRFMSAMADELAQRGIATLRFQFPYMERGGRRPDRPPVLTGTVRAAVELASQKGAKLALFAGGKSMGGRMTSLAASENSLPRVRGLVFFGFPLHAAGRPSAARAEHLAAVELPLLFLQGTRDKLAELELLRPECRKLGARATLHIAEGGDHSFKVLKRSGRTDEGVLAELAETTRDWMDRVAR